VNDRGGNGADCFDVKESSDTMELTNVKFAGLGKCRLYLVGERQVFIKDPRLRAEWVVLREQFCILASCCLSQMRRNSVLEELRVSIRRLAE